jgi:hypothetical protein
VIYDEEQIALPIGRETLLGIRGLGGQASPSPDLVQQLDEPFLDLIEIELRLAWHCHVPTMPIRLTTLTH